MALEQLPALLLVAEELELVRRARVQRSQAQVLLEAEGRVFHPGHPVEFARESTKHLLEEA